MNAISAIQRRNRINTGVYVFTRVNVYGIRQLKEKGAVHGYRAVTRSCCGVNVLKGKERGAMRLLARLRACSLRCAVRKGSSLRFDRWRGVLRTALTDGSAAAVLQR